MSSPTKCPLHHQNQHEASTATTNVDEKEQQQQKLKIAQTLASELGYSQEQIEYLGNDVVKMLSTGSPFPRSNLKAGDFVVDLSCGYGLDAVLASKVVGPTGRVVGVDLDSTKLIAAITTACQDRKLRNVDFRIGNTSEPPFEDGVVDVVIGNGNYCHVENHLQAFKEAHRILKSGGTLSATFNTRASNVPGEFPAFVQQFAFFGDLERFLKEAGFVDVQVDKFETEKDVMMMKAKLMLGLDVDVEKESNEEGKEPSPMFLRFKEAYKLRQGMVIASIVAKKP